MKSKITLRDIAIATGFSKTTISRYFNSPHTVSEENKAKIAKVIDEMAYRKNSLARILAKGRSNFIGIIIPNFPHQFYWDILTSLIGGYDSHGYKFLIFLENEDIETEWNYINELCSYSIEGLIVLGHNIKSIELSKIGIPVIGIEREAKNINSVDTDNFLGGQMACIKLLEDNCNVFVTVNLQASQKAPGELRVKGFEDICNKNDVKCINFNEEIFYDQTKTASVLESIYEYLNKKYPKKKKGVFILSDTYANQFINILKRNDSLIPDEWEIIGFDNAMISRESVIPFTTIGQDVQSIVKSVIDILEEKIRLFNSDKPHGENKHILVRPSLIVRQTTLQ